MAEVFRRPGTSGDGCVKHGKMSAVKAVYRVECSALGPVNCNLVSVKAKFFWAIFLYQVAVKGFKCCLLAYLQESGGGGELR